MLPFTLLLLSASTPAHAWDKHQVILERLMDTRAAKIRIYPYQKINIPCPDKEKEELAVLGKRLQINVEKVPLFSKGRCKPGETSTEIILSDLILSQAIDEPDQGMDQDLPDADDPLNERKWMGGTTGPTSQGFRHMYFKGFEIGSPLKTMQIPLGAVGQALERVKKMREASDAYFKKGDKFWGTRVLLWELHYMQDLQQPFHVIQIPSTHFVAWNKLFSGFVKATTHSIANYHYAYEGLALELTRDASTNDFSKCFEYAEEHDEEDRRKDEFQLIAFSSSVGNELGADLYNFLGDDPKAETADYPGGVGAPDYFALLHLTEPHPLTEEELGQISKKDKELHDMRVVQFGALGEIKRITCDLMKQVTLLTWHEFDRAYLKVAVEPTSNKSAK